MQSMTFTLVFVALLLASVLAKMVLSSRQMRYVAEHRAQVPAAFADTVPLAAHQKAADYTVAKSRLGLIELFFGTAVLLIWTLLGGLNVLNQGLLHFFEPGMTQQIALILSFSLIGGLLDLPLGLYQTFVLEERFGFNKMTLKLWCQDLLKSTLLGLVIGVPLLMAVLWFMAATGPWWWLWTWAFWMVFSLVLMVLVPTVIAPLFNQFKPLDNPDLQVRVQALMQRCGFAAKGLFVMDGSKRSAHANAYFTGFGRSKRVVFFDTLLARLNGDELEAVLAHELGHFHHKHILKRLMSMAVLTLLGFAALGYVSEQAWFYTGLGVAPLMNGSNSALALLLFLMVVPLVTFWTSPLSAHVSCKHEFEADAYACRQVSGAHLSAALLKLYEDNASTLTPDPWYVRFYYSHPPALQRLARMTHASAPS